MTGVRNGVVARLHADNPHIVGIHCVAHRLALATIKATDSSPEIRMYEKVIKDLYNYFAHSSTRRVELHLWQSIYDGPHQMQTPPVCLGLHSTLSADYKWLHI